MLHYPQEIASSPRFGWVMQGQSHGTNAAFDQDLARYEEAAIIPTQGAFLAEWLLVVPRTPCLSVSELDISARARLLSIADEVATHVARKAGNAVIFEHGPRRAKTLTGCGVDQAHLHVVGWQSDLFDQLTEEVGEVKWKPANYLDPWGEIQPDSDYLMIRDSRRSAVAVVESPSSQRLRRALASVTGHKDEWDYRTHPNPKNALCTQALFRDELRKHAAA